MVLGAVSDDGVPVIELAVAGNTWSAIIDTGFNGYVELPGPLRPSVNARFIGRLESLLAAGQSVLEDNYEVEFPFDGRLMQVEATFSPGGQILIGTGLLRDHRLEIDFAERTVVLERTL